MWTEVQSLCSIRSRLKERICVRKKMIAVGNRLAHAVAVLAQVQMVAVLAVVFLVIFRKKKFL